MPSYVKPASVIFTTIAILSFFILQLKYVSSNFCTCKKHFYGGKDAVCRDVPDGMINEVLQSFTCDVTKLTIENSSLERLQLQDAEIFNNLKKLKVVKCNLTDIDLLLTSLQGIMPSKVYFIDFSENNITALGQETFRNYDALVRLSFKSNYIHSIRNATFENKTELEFLDLSQNLIKYIEDEVFYDTKKMKELKLSYNNLTFLGKNLFQTTQQLTSLYLDNNYFEKIPINSLEKLTKLQVLDLSHNRITRITEVLSKLKTLKFLYLSDNRINHIDPSAFTYLYHLSVLWLKNNMLTNLPSLMSIRLYQMNSKNVFLQGNPWHCECDSIWVILWVQQIGVRSNRSDLMCTSPNKELMSEIDITSLNCDCPGDQPQCCPFGFGNTAVDGCRPCPQNTYRKSNSTNDCLPCNDKSSTLSPGSTECFCDAGYTLSSNSTSCEPCPKGSYKDKIGPHECSLCPPFSSSGSASTSENNCTCLYGENHVISRLDILCKEDSDNKGLEPDTVTAHVVTLKATSAAENVKTKEEPVLVFFAVSVGLIFFVLAVVVIGIYSGRRKKYRFFFKHIKLHPESHNNKDGQSPLLYSPKMKNLYKEIEVTPKQLKIGKIIGEGAFGRVFEGHACNLPGFQKSYTKVAIKRLKDDASHEEKDAFQKELHQMLYVGKHPNIIRLIGACVMKDMLLLVLEFADHGDLLTYLRNLPQHNISTDTCDFGNTKLPPELLRKLTMFAWQISKGMSHLEKLKCIHRDLAARNVLLTKGPVAKVSDFGLARDVYESAYYFKVSKGRLPYKWMSPEALMTGRYSTKSDIWSFGVVLWEIMTIGGTPYPGVPLEMLCEMYSTGYRMPIPPTCPDNVYEIMKNCWLDNPKERPKFHTIVEMLDKNLQNAAHRNYIEIQPDNETHLNKKMEHNFSKTGIIFSTMSSCKRKTGKNLARFPYQNKRSCYMSSDSIELRRSIEDMNLLREELNNYNSNNPDPLYNPQHLKFQKDIRIRMQFNPLYKSCSTNRL